MRHGDLRHAAFGEVEQGIEDRVRRHGRIQEDDRLVHPSPGFVMPPDADIGDEAPVELGQEQVAGEIAALDVLIEALELRIVGEEGVVLGDADGVRDLVHPPVVGRCIEPAVFQSRNHRRRDVARLDPEPFPLGHRVSCRGGAPPPSSLTGQANYPDPGVAAEPTTLVNRGQAAGPARRSPAEVQPRAGAAVGRRVRRSRLPVPDHPEPHPGCGSSSSKRRRKAPAPHRRGL